MAALRSTEALKEPVARLAWVGTALRIAAAWVGLCLVVYLLLGYSLLRWLRQPHASMLVLDPPPAELHETGIPIRGRTHRDAVIELGVDDRVLEIATADHRGAFQAWLRLPPAASRLWARAAGENGKEIGRAEYELRWKAGTFPTQPGFCVVDTTLGLTWVAASGTPGEDLLLQRAPDDPGQKVIVDQRGAVDLLVPLDGPSPESLTLAGSGSPSVAVPCRQLGADETLPLTRSTTVSDHADLEKLAAQLEEKRGVDDASSPSKLFSAALPEAQVEVTLPAAHPYVRALTTGRLSATEFVRVSVGDLGGLIDADTAALLARETGADSSPAALSPQVSVSMSGTLATVSVQARLFGFGLGERAISFQRGNDDGIASRPLLTVADRFLVRTSAAHRWSFDTVPHRLEAGVATWAGPLDFDQITASRALPPNLTRQLTFGSRRAGSDSAEPTSQGEYLRALDRAERWHPLVELWRVLLALLPAAAVGWLLHRRGAYGSLGGAHALQALSILAGAVLSAPFFHTLIDTGLGRLLGTLLSLATQPIAGGILPIAAQEVAHQRFDLARATPWLLLAAVLGATPLFLDGLVGRLATAGGDRLRPSRRRSWWRRLLLGVRLAYGVALLAMLWLAVASEKLFESRWHESVKIEPLHAVFAAGLAPLLLFSSLLVCAGLRGLFFTAAFTMAAVGLVAPPSSIDGDAWGWMAAFASCALALTAIWLLSYLLGVAVPVAWRRPSRLVVAVALTAAGLWLGAVAAKFVLIVAAGLVALGLVWALLVAYSGLTPTRTLTGRMSSRPFLTAVALFAFGAAVGWPVEGGERLRLHVHDLAGLVARWGSLLPPLLGVGLALLVRQRRAASGHRLLDGDQLLAGTLLYAIFLVGPTTTWLLIPLPLLIAVAMARHWLFENEAGRRELAVLAAEPVASRRLAEGFVAAETARLRTDAALRTIDKKYESAELAPDAYEEQRRQYVEHGKEHEEDAKRARRVFALGDDDSRARVLAFARIGLLLASAPILISLYAYLPVSKVSYPYPIADFFTFLLAAILEWGLYAAFFGIFFASLRGATGLGKGMSLFLAIAVPFAVYRLVGGPSVVELRPFLFWLAQLFVFFGLLGLFAGDLRLLELAGSSTSGLRTLHRLPTLSAFLSTAAAVIVPAVLAIVADKAGDVVKFFIEVVIPGSAGGS